MDACASCAALRPSRSRCPRAPGPLGLDAGKGSSPSTSTRPSVTRALAAATESASCTSSCNVFREPGGHPWDPAASHSGPCVLRSRKVAYTGGWGPDEDLNVLLYSPRCPGTGAAPIPIPSCTFEAPGRVCRQPQGQVQADARGAAGDEHHRAVHGEGVWGRLWARGLVAPASLRPCPCPRRASPLVVSPAPPQGRTLQRSLACSAHSALGQGGDEAPAGKDLPRLLARGRAKQVWAPCGHPVRVSPRGMPLSPGDN